ncbi:anaerobic ribonucleoside-triphosphate reductase activating protein [Actinomycetaceae bacterium L2_0104]
MIETKHGARAADLAIAGLVPLSSVDWPDHLVATVFCQGCPWRCPYCQNAGILDPHTPGILSWEDVTALLRKRRGLLDGVVFTGGEALRQEALVPAMQEVREMGLSLGLHTAGAYPRRLGQVLPLLNWVGLDIKAAPQDYREAAGFDGGDKAWRALDLVLEEERDRSEGSDPFTYEVRLTVFPGAPAERDFPRFLSLLRQAGVEYFALQEARTQGTDEIFQAMAERWDKSRWRSRYEEMSREAREAGFTSVEIR